MTSLITADHIDVLAQQVMNYCDKLATYTQSEGMVDRRYLTPEHQQTNTQLSYWAKESGLEYWQDEAGNQWTRLSAASSVPNPKRLIMGSHTDTVPNGGRYDGILGVIAPLVLLKHFCEHKIQFNFHLDVVGFGDEEGTRFGSTLLGSSAIAGTWQPNWQDLSDSDGVSVGKAMQEFGLAASSVQNAKIDYDRVLAYLETHIEQGPILEQREQPLAAVKGIAGARRFEVTITGKAGHAGTVPMSARNDPLVIASEWVGEVNKLASSTIEPAVVATVGKLEVLPGAVNVVPGQVVMSLDIRSLSDSARDEIVDILKDQLSAKTETAELKLDWLETHSAGAVVCDVALTQRVTDVVEQIYGDSPAMVSGAGHDAMALAPHVPTTMLFVRCKEGISHHPDESINQQDVSAALSVLTKFVEQLSD